MRLSLTGFFWAKEQCWLSFFFTIKSPPIPVKNKFKSQLSSFNISLVNWSGSWISGPVGSMLSNLINGSVTKLNYKVNWSTIQLVQLTSPVLKTLINAFPQLWWWSKFLFIKIFRNTIIIFIFNKTFKNK